MMRALGFGSTSPTSVASAVKGVRQATLLECGQKLTDTVRNTVVIVPGIQTLRRNVEVFRQSEKLTCLVCDSFWPLSNIGMSVADVEKTKALRYKPRPMNAAEIVESLDSAAKWAFSVKGALSPSDWLLKRTQYSVVGKLQSFLYRIQDLERREHTKRFIFDTLEHGSFTASIVSLSSSFKKSQALPDLIATLTSPECATLARAVELTRSGQSVPVVVKKLGISAFDLNYTMSYLNKVPK